MAAAYFALANAAARPDSVTESITVRLEKSDSGAPLSGRIVVYFLDASESGRPGDGPFLFNPQPILGTNVEGLRPGQSVTLNSGSDGFPDSLASMAGRRFKVQAVLDRRRENSRWDREPGNLYSDVSEVVWGPGNGSAVTLDLSHSVGNEARPNMAGIRWYEIKSQLLTRFRGSDTFLKAAVLLPQTPVSEGPFPALYFVPAFGEDARGGVRSVLRELARAGEAGGQVRKRACIVVLDPEGPNGHHLFADSENNGPVGRALTRELIPALEAEFPLRKHPDSRLLRGHSSGGWSVIWLTLTYPEVFGGCWSTAPDPVSFAAFQGVNLYTSRNLFRESGADHDRPSVTVDGRSVLTIREENRVEDVIGPGNTSAQQWDSWLAAFGHRLSAGGGRPADLFDPRTGEVDHAQLDRWAQYDIHRRLCGDPDRLLPILRDRVHVLVGDRDEFSLHHAVSILRSEVERRGAFHGAGQAEPGASMTSHGYMELPAGENHFSVLQRQYMIRMYGEIATWFSRTSSVRAPETP